MSSRTELRINPAETWIDELRVEAQFPLDAVNTPSAQIYASKSTWRTKDGDQRDVTHTELVRFVRPEGRYRKSLLERGRKLHHYRDARSGQWESGEPPSARQLAEKVRVTEGEEFLADPELETNKVAVAAAHMLAEIDRWMTEEVPF